MMNAVQSLGTDQTIASQPLSGTTDLAVAMIVSEHIKKAGPLDRDDLWLAVWTVRSAFAEQNFLKLEDETEGEPVPHEEPRVEVQAVSQGELLPRDTVARKATPKQIRESIRDDALISFIDGRPYKMLKRHLTTHGMSPDDYRRRYGLPEDYPMVTKAYSEFRAQIARDNGLGRIIGG